MVCEVVGVVVAAVVVCGCGVANGVVSVADVLGVAVVAAGVCGGVDGVVACVWCLAVFCWCA